MTKREEKASCPVKVGDYIKVTEWVEPRTPKAVLFRVMRVLDSELILGQFVQVSGNDQLKRGNGNLYFTNVKTWEYITKEQFEAMYSLSNNA